MSDTKNGKREKWFQKDDSTKRTAPSPSNDDLKRQIAEIEKSQLPKAVKAASITALKAEAENGKPFTLTISRANKQGMRDLIAVSGGFKEKQLSPALLAEVVANVEFVKGYLETVFAQDDA